MKRSHKILVTIAGLGVALAVAGYFHFHDDPPPDLSRFPEPVYDAEAYAESKRLADAFLAKRVEYKPKEPGDIDEDEIDDENQLIVPRALRNDPVALRCLRREIEENKEAISLAEKLLTAPRWVWSLPSKDTPIIFDAKTIPSARAAIRLLSDAAILKMMTGEPDEAWRITGIIGEKSRVRHESAHSLIHHLTAVALDGLSESLIVKLAHTDTDPKRVENAFVLLRKTAPQTVDVKRAWNGELHYFKATLLQITGGTRPAKAFDFEESAAFLPDANTEKEISAPEKWLRKQAALWRVMNILPNATMSLYANNVAEALDHPEKITAKPKTKETFFFCRNAGGKTLVNTSTAIAGIIDTNGHSTTARNNLARIAVGVRLYQLSHDGKNPATLADLVPGILPAIPNDPFGNQPLRYDARSGKAWSVGPDLKDDGGKPYDDVTVN